MLHWLQLNTPRRVSFFIELILFSLLLHVVILGMFFYCYLKSDLGYHITLGSSRVDLAEIVVMPFGSPVHMAQQAPSKQVLTPKRVAQKKPVAATTIKNSVPQKTAVPKKAPQKKAAPPLKKIEPKKAEQKKEVPQKKLHAAEAAKKNEPIKAQSDVPAEQVKSSPPSIVSQKEYDILELQNLLQEELEHHWQPPEGLAPDLSCQVRVSVGNGAVEELDIVAPSGVLIYDIHAQSTLMALQYPKQTWGKQLTITFKQA